MGKKKRKDLTEENVTNTDVVGFGEMAIQQTITNCSDIAKNTAAIVELGALEANQNNRFNAFEAKLRFNAFEAKLELFMQKFSGQQRTATPVAGGLGQGVQFSGQQKTATPAAGGLGKEVKKAPWTYALRPPDTVADIISGTWLDDGYELVFINTKVLGERAGFVTGETPGDGGLWLSFIGYTVPPINLRFEARRRRRATTKPVLIAPIAFNEAPLARCRKQA